MKKHKQISKRIIIQVPKQVKKHMRSHFINNSKDMERELHKYIPDQYLSDL